MYSSVTSVLKKAYKGSNLRSSLNCIAFCSLSIKIDLVSHFNKDIFNLLSNTVRCSPLKFLIHSKA